MTERVKLTIEELSGGAAPVLEEFLAHPQVVAAKTMDITIAMALCRRVVERRCIEALEQLVCDKLQEAYDMYVLTHGEFKEIDNTGDYLMPPDDWEEGIDNEVERVLTPYEKMVSASWFGQKVIDTHLHAELKPGDTPPVIALAQSFAKEAWTNIISYTHRNEDDSTELRQRTSAQILSGAGIMRTDLEELLQDKLTTQAAANEAAAQPEPMIMPTVDEVIAKIYAHKGGDVSDEPGITSLLEMALDEDDGLALSGITPLGGDMADVEALRVFELTEGLESSAATAEALMDKLREADGSIPAALRRAPVAVTTEATAQTLPPQPAPVAAPGTVPPPVTTGEAPAKPKRARKGAQTEVPPGALGPDFFTALRASIKLKDEEVAAGIGVSRQTYINYTKRGAYTPNAEQRKWLVDTIQAHIGNLSTALALVQTE